MAAAKAGKLIAELPLAAMSQAREDSQAADFAEAEKLRDIMASRFFTQFWEDGSTYLATRDDAGKALSRMYILNQRSSIKRFASQYPLFQRTPLRALTLLILEGFRDYLRTKGISPNTRNAALNALRSPISWAQKRGLIEASFSFSGIERPKTTYRKRGVLTSEEVVRIIALEVAPVWEGEESGKVHFNVRPRPRLAKGSKHEGPAPIHRNRS